MTTLSKQEAEEQIWQDFEGDITSANDAYDRAVAQAKSDHDLTAAIAHLRRNKALARIAA